MMERRSFLKAFLATNGILWGSSLPAVASSLPSAIVDATPVLVIYQSDNPCSVAVGMRLASAIRGAENINITCTSRLGVELRDVSTINALVAMCRQGVIIGVMDDASGLIFQEVASSTRVGFLAHTQHRIHNGNGRHNSRMWELDDEVTWSDETGNWPMPLASLYTALLPGRPSPGALPEGHITLDAIGYASFVSFALKA